MPVPVGAPGTTIANTSNNGTLDARAYNKLLMKNPKMVPLTVKSNGFEKVGGSLKNGGGFYTQAFILGTTAGSALSHAVGWGSTGDFMCDVKIAFFDGCAQLKAPQYVDNSDIVQVVPGWTPTNVYQFSGVPSDPYSHTFNSGTFSLTVDAVQPAYVPGPQKVTMTARVNGQCTQAGTNAYISNFLPRMYVYERNTGTGVVLRTNTSIDWLNWVNKCNANEITRTTTYSPRSGFEFDHLEVPPLTDVGHAWPTAPYATPTQHPAWYPEGHPSRPPEVDGNPVRAWKIEFKCSDGAMKSASSSPFRESDVEWPAMPGADCDAGSILQSAKMWQTTEGGEPKLVWEFELPPEVAPNAACLESGTCVLELERVLPGGRTVSCFSDPDGCTDWFKDPEKEKVYQCKYNGSLIALNECNVYAPTFNPDRPPDVDYGDPITGEIPAPAPTPPTVGDPGRSTECFPSGWGVFNPAEWVYKPITCALHWAFVPKPGTVGQALAGLQDGLKSHAPFSVIVAIPGVVGAIGEGFNAGCSGMPDFSAIDGLHLQLPCEPPDSAAWRAAYTLQTIILWTTVAISAWHMVSRSIGGKE